MKPLLSMLLAVLLAGCSLFGGEEAAPSPSDVDQNILEQLESGGEETAVPPTEPAPTETATPEAANESEAAAEGEGNAVAKNEKSTLRSGPGEEFPEIEATVENGESLSVLGLDESGDWANVALPNGENGWLPLEDIQLNTPLEDIGIVLTIPAIPALPTIQGVPDIPAIPTLPPINVP